MIQIILFLQIIYQTIATVQTETFKSKNTYTQCIDYDCTQFNKYSFHTDHLDCSNSTNSTLFNNMLFSLNLPPRSMIISQNITLNISTFFDIYSPHPIFAIYINNNAQIFTISSEFWNDQCEGCSISKSFILTPFESHAMFVNGTNAIKIVSYTNIVCISDISIDINYRLFYPIVTHVKPTLGPVEGGTEVTVMSKLLYSEYDYVCCFNSNCVDLNKTETDQDNQHKGTCIAPPGENINSLSVTFKDEKYREDEMLFPRNSSYEYYNLSIVSVNMLHRSDNYYLEVVCDGLVESPLKSFCQLVDISNETNDTYLHGEVQNKTIICLFDPEKFDLKQNKGKKYYVHVSINGGVDYTKENFKYTIELREGSTEKITILVIVVFSVIVVLLVMGFLIFTKFRQKTEDVEFINPDEVTLQELLGRGSYGDVYSASWRGQEIAVKLIPTKNMLEDSMLQFTKEVQLMRKLRHPCVLQFFGSGTDANFILIAMELMTRGSAHTLLMNKSLPISWERRLRMLKDTASGMYYLHSSTPPIIHLDLKSHNLLVDDNWKVKVSDFGLSMTSLEGLHSNAVCGTLAWTAPEMLKSKPVSTKADVYSYAIVMWEFLARATPYPGIPRYHLIEKVGEIGFRPDIPQNNHIEFCQLMQQCWETNPEDRPDFGEILIKIDEFIVEETNKHAFSNSVSLDESE